MICCYQITKFSNSKNGSAIASSVRDPCNFGPFTDLAISVFREMSINGLPKILQPFGDLKIQWVVPFLS